MLAVPAPEVTHDIAPPGLDAATPSRLPLEQLARTQLVRSQLVDSTVRSTMVLRRRRRPEGELRYHLVLAGLKVRQHGVQVCLQGLKKASTIMWRGGGEIDSPRS